MTRYPAWLLLIASISHIHRHYKTISNKLQNYIPYVKLNFLFNILIEEVKWLSAKCTTCTQKVRCKFLYYIVYKCYINF